jgi:predicted amidohydrolase YtcJ
VAYVSTTVLRDVRLGGRVVEVLLRDDRVVDVAPAVSAPPGSTEVDGGGGVLLPGLHDHHVHVLSFAAQRLGVDCSAFGTDVDALVAALRGAPGDWVRATGYHESQAGPLDRRVLDAWVPDRPVRVQHRSGALWMLSSAAIGRMWPVLDDTPDVERDAAGEPTGRLWRYDERLRTALGDSPLDLGPVGGIWAELGVTGLTDATPDLTPGAVDLLTSAQALGALPQSLLLLGTDDVVGGPDVRTGPRKLLLRDHDLPDLQTLTRSIRTWHARGRGVAVHVVTAESLVLTLAALEAAGAHPADRIEHASVVLPGTEAWLASSGATVVTQPDFLRTRGEQYRRDLDAIELASLYRHRSLAAAGIGMAVSSDAPFGSHDPWKVIASARDRLTADGVVLGADESVSAGEALASYLSHPDAPAGPPRRVEVGVPADLCLLDGDIVDALREPHADRVRLTVTARAGHHRLHGR